MSVASDMDVMRTSLAISKNTAAPLSLDQATLYDAYRRRASTLEQSTSPLSALTLLVFN